MKLVKAFLILFALLGYVGIATGGDSNNNGCNVEITMQDSAVRFQQNTTAIAPSHSNIQSPLDTVKSRTIHSPRDLVISLLATGAVALINSNPISIGITAGVMFLYHIFKACTKHQTTIEQTSQENHRQEYGEPEVIGCTNNNQPILVSPEIICKKDDEIQNLSNDPPVKRIYLDRPKLDTYTPLLLVRQKQRDSIIEKYNDCTAVETCYVKLSNNAASLVSRYRIHSSLFERCDGMHVQRHIHQEFVDIIERISAIEDKIYHSRTAIDSVELLVETAVRQAAIGCRINKEEDCVREASLLADFCWAASDCIAAIGKGVVQGVVNAAHNIAHTVLHPIEAASDVFQTAEKLAHCGTKVLFEVCELGSHILFDERKAKQKIDSWTLYCHNRLKHAQIILHNYSRAECVCIATAAATEFILTRKSSAVMGRFFSKAAKQLKKYKNLFDNMSGPSACALTVEGIPIKVATDIFKGTKRKTISAFAKKSKYGFNGKDAITKKFFFQHTPLGKKLYPHKIGHTRKIDKITKHITNPQIQKGSYIYLDRLHGDHLEVFSPTGKAYKVFNFDGTINWEKTFRALEKGRTLKDI